MGNIERDNKDEMEKNGRKEKDKGWERWDKIKWNMRGEEMG